MALTPGIPKEPGDLVNDRFTLLGQVAAAETLADDTRKRIQRTGGYSDLDQCLSRLVADTVASVDFHIDHFYQQEYYVELWFEAKAMAGQFQHYTEGIDLVPFGGDPSIPFKWEIAQSLARDRRAYGKPVKVLYFGDYDEHGLQIVESAETDIRNWSQYDFELIRCGLTLEQARHYEIMENPAKPGDYQWEALDDGAAAEIIADSLAEHLDMELIKSVNEESRREEAHWRELIEDAMENLISEERGE